jgi:hypothetical protein
MNTGVRHLLKLASALALAVSLAAPAHAGRSCETRPPSASSIVRGMALAERVAQALDATQAQVVVLARAGQDLSAHGLRYSHLGFAYRSAPAVANAPGEWRVVHKLNTCGSAVADIYRQGLGEFFNDDPFDYAAAFVVLSPQVQARLLPLLQDNAQVALLHEPAYNLVAYPWSQQYQQSNQWAIETLALSQEPSATTRARAQAWLQFKGYQPTTLRLGALTRLGARMTAANVAFDDHPGSKRFADRIETVTADSVFVWLQSAGLGLGVQELR